MYLPWFYSSMRCGNNNLLSCRHILDKAKIYEDFVPLNSNDVAEAIYFMVTRPKHVSIQDIQIFGTQQASATIVDRSGR